MADVSDSSLSTSLQNTVPTSGLHYPSRPRFSFATFRQSLVIAPLLCCCVVAVAAWKKAVPDVVQARSFQLVDDTGKVRLTIGASGGGPLVKGKPLDLSISDENGQRRFFIAMTGDQTIVDMSGPSGGAEELRLSAGFQSVGSNNPKKAHIAALQMAPAVSEQGEGNPGPRLDLRVQSGAGSIDLKDKKSVSIVHLPPYPGTE